MSAGSDSIPLGCSARTGRSRRSERRSRATARRYRARCADPGNINGEPISMERMEFVGEATNAECRWPVSRENSGEWQPRYSRVRNGRGQPSDEFWMQPSDRAFGPLPRHGVARRRRLNQIGAGARRLVGFCCMFRTHTLAHVRRLALDPNIVGPADWVAISSFYWNRLD